MRSKHEASRQVSLLASRFSRHASPSAAGFTLVEIIIAICLMGLIIAIVLPQFGRSANLASTSRQLIGMIRSLYVTASSTKRLHRLYLDLDRQVYWAMAVHPDGERPPANSALAERITLPEAIRLADATTETQGKLAIGRALIQFSPGGRTERSLIHLTDTDGNAMTLRVNPVTGSVQVMEGYAEPAAEPITDLIKTAFFLPLASLPGGSPGGGVLR